MFLESIWLEAIIIFVLVIINGFLSGSEMAIVAARRSKIEQMASEGDPSAALVKGLKEKPDRFLATIQIGITLVGTMAAAVGGAAAVESLKPIIQRVLFGPVQGLAEVISIGLVVVLISYFTLILGELVPKSLALKYSEKIACFTARPLNLLSRLSSVLVKFLTRSTGLVLFLFGVKEVRNSAFVTEEEVKYMIKEGRESGVFDETEQELIHSIFEFTDTSVKDVMIPRSRMQVLDIDTPPEDVLRFMVETGYSRFPVYKETPDKIAGILYNKDVLRMLDQDKAFVLKDILRKPYFVPETAMISNLLKAMQKQRMHMAIVVNEHGEIDGMITIEDLLEEIVGEIEDEYMKGEDIKGPVESLKDGSMVIDASVFLRDLEIEPPLPIEESEDYDTLAGFVLYKLQKIPKGGEIVSHDGYRFTVVDMEDNRIAKVKVEKEGSNDRHSKRKKATKK
ncbi:MAG: hemolysin family protein [Thermodesulfobacteriota bacterium]